MHLDGPPMIWSVILCNFLSVPSVSLWCNSYLYIEGLRGVVAEDVDQLAHAHLLQL